MSYILEALRKADAQRQRERPGLHAQPAAAVPESQARSWAHAPLAWGVGAIVVVAAAVILWPSGQPALPGPSAVATVPPPAPAVAVAEARPIQPAAAIEPPPPPIVAVAPPPPAARTAAPAIEARKPAGPAATTAVAPASAPAKNGTEGPAPPDAPKLAITGGVYSSNPAQRMLIVGGQVFNEGSELAPGVVLEQVRPHQALLSFRGQRYTVAY